VSEFCRAASLTIHYACRLPIINNGTVPTRVRASWRSGKLQQIFEDQKHSRNTTYFKLQHGERLGGGASPAD